MIKSNPQIPRIAIGVLVQNKQGEVLLAKAPKWDGKWIVPGGHLEWGEKLEECAKREIKEETSLDIYDVEFLNIRESVFPPEFHEERHFIFVDFIAKTDSSDVKLNHEAEDFRWLKPEDALKMNLNNSTRQFIEEFINKKS